MMHIHTRSADPTAHSAPDNTTTMRVLIIAMLLAGAAATDSEVPRDIVGARIERCPG